MEYESEAPTDALEADDDMETGDLGDGARRAHTEIEPPK